MDLFYQTVFAECFKKSIELKSVTPLSGGCINKAVKVVTDQGVFCVKTNQASLYPQMFQKEAKGLEKLNAANTIRVPEPLHTGEVDGIQYIILEFLESGTKVSNFWEDFATSLAALHNSRADRFGLEFDNYIGTLPQKNKWSKNGSQFFIEQRLFPQLKLASQKGLADKKLIDQFGRLFKRLPDLLPSPKPSLLHGDLWSGNMMVGPDGKIALIDPAVFYGSAEAEIAFTKLFGGFDEPFYQSYYEVHQPDPGYEERYELYNLYPLMVHVNLFGGSYLTTVQNILASYS